MENENKNIDKIIDRLQNGVREIFEGDNFKHYLEVMAKFHTFSSYNWQLIYEQCPNATKLAGYVQWKRDFNRHVKKEKRQFAFWRHVSEKVECVALKRFVFLI